MPYTPINAQAYTASYAGAIAGMAVSGWIIDPLSADYSKATIIAGAFAEAFDLAWNSAAQLNELEQAAMTSVVQEDFRGRGPGPFENPRFQNFANWSVTAAACVALILECDIFFAGQGIVPPVSGGGSPLTNVLYVDGSTTTPIPSQTGAISAPFSTIQPAIHACPVGGTILITTDGDYSATITIPNSLSLKALSNGIPGISQTNNGSLIPAQAVLGTINITTGTVTFDNMVITEIEGLDNTVKIGCSNCTILGSDDGDSITNQGGANYPSVTLANTTVVEGIVCNTIQTTNCVLNGNVTVHTPSPSNAMSVTKFPTPGTTVAFIVAGNLTVDSATNQNIWEGGVTLSQCTPVVSGSSVTMQLQTPIPLAASGAGGFTTLLTYSTVGTTAKQKIEAGIDATATDANTPATPVVGELRANRSYYITGGALTLLNDSTVFSSANLQFIISGTNLLLQGAFNAAGGHTLNYVGQLYIKVTAISP
jgi:hypothetical protein